MYAFEDTMENLLNHATAAAVRYLEQIDGRGVAPTEDAIRGLAELDEPLPDGQSRAEDVFDALDRIGSPATVGTSGGRYFGFVHGGSVPAALAANWLAAAWDQNAGLYVTSPVASALEERSLCWLRDVLALPPQCGGGFVTGATMANFTALAAARHAVLAETGWDVEADGWNGAPAVTVIVSNEVHPAVTKALALLGFGRARAVRVPVDTQGRMRVDALPEFQAPAIICVQAGNVNTGAFDPISEICDIAHARSAWVHVDGAFGLWAAASPQHAHLAAGAGKADSWATDAHKWLNVPYDSGLAFVRNAENLKRAMTLSAAYIPHGSRRDPSLYTPELSRRARGIEVWAALRSLGRSGLADLIDGTCRHARRFAEGLEAAGYRVLNDVVLNQVLVSFGDAAATLRIIDRIQREGTCWCGQTVWQGTTAMRISVCSWATTDDDVEQSLDAMLRAAAAEHGPA